MVPGTGNADYLSAVAVLGVGMPDVLIAVICVSVVSWKIVWVSLVPKWRFPDEPHASGSACAR